MSSPRPQRKATKRLYANDGAPVGSDVEMSEGEQATRRGGRGVNKGKGQGKTTKSKSKAVVASDGEQEDEDELDGSSEVEQPTKKRKKASKKQRKNSKQQQKKGKLELINTLPVELFAEICSYLTPGDLLALSITSKAFRSLLISPGSLSLWKASRRSLGLPDLTAGDMTETQYAHLVFGTRCDLCGCKDSKLADFLVRKRLCNPCRKSNWVKLDYKLKDSFADIHPSAALACLYTVCSPACREPYFYPRHENQVKYAYLADLEFVSNKLWELDPKPPADDHHSEVDEDEELLRELLEQDEKTNAPATRTRQPRRPSLYGHNAFASSDRGSSSNGLSPKLAEDVDEQQGEEDDDEEAAAQKAAYDQLVLDRKHLRKKAVEDGKAIYAAVVKMKKAAKEQAYERRWDKELARNERRDAVEEKVLDEFDDCAVDDFIDARLWRTSKIVNEGGPLTDEGWEEIKPKVVKLLARIKAEDERAKLVQGKLARQQALRPRYKKLLDLQANEQSRHSLPLFADFLHLASVKELWETDEADPEDDEVWGEHLDAILEELDEYRLDVRLQAVQTILAATTEMDEEELDGDAESFGPDSYDDEWLARPTSFLVCNLPDCSRRGRWSGGTSGDLRPAFFGSLPDLLAHQHEHHSALSLTDKQRKKRETQGLVGHFHLPPLVVSALSSIIELAGVEDDEATVNDLSAVTRHNGPTYSWSVPQLPAYLVWENAPSNKHNFPRWIDLIDEAIKQAEKAAKSKRILEVPTIALHDRVADKEERQKERAKKRRGKGKVEGEEARGREEVAVGRADLRRTCLR